jgi:hypothetical protein
MDGVGQEQYRSSCQEAVNTQRRTVMTKVAEDAYGTKVWVQLEWEQIDAMIAKELKEHVGFTARDVAAARTGEGWAHPEDVEYNEKLLPALLVVYEHWAGEEAAKKLKQEVGYED